MEGDFFDRLMARRIFAPIRPFFLKYREAILYMLVSDLTLLISLSSFWLLVYPCHMDPVLVNPLTWILRVAFAYSANRAWVFPQKAAKGKAVIGEAASFAASRLVTLFTEELVLWVGIDLLGLNKMWVKVCAQILVFVGNYIASKFFVFKKKSDPSVCCEESCQAYEKQ